MTGAFSAWTALLAVAHFALGVTLGLVYFRTVWWSARRLAANTPSWTVAGMAGRLALLASALALISVEGAAALLATGAGLLAGRAIVLHSVQAATP